MSAGIPSKVFAEHMGGVAVIQDMDSTAEHPEKARAPMFCKDRSILIVRAEVQLSNALAPTRIMVDGRLISFKLEHPLHSSSGISVMVGVKTNSSREAQPRKAPFPSSEMEASREKAFNCEQPSKAYSPMTESG